MAAVKCSTASFLDHAWVAQSPIATQPSKTARTHRKQNRCCDQCRKGKRACDATILEDSLLDANPPCGRDQKLFHYSDIFGPLAPCGNCEKTRKKCTFEWLRSQRVSQAIPQSKPSPPPKKRRKSDSPEECPGQPKTVAAVAEVPESIVIHNEDLGPPHFYGVFDEPHYDLTLEPKSVGTDHLASLTDIIPDCHGADAGFQSYMQGQEGLLDDKDIFKWDEVSSYGSMSSRSPSSGTSENAESEVIESLECITSESNMPPAVQRASQASLSVFSDMTYVTRTPSPSLKLERRISVSTDNASITERLFKIYHDSFENAFSYLLTESTCPYSKRPDASFLNNFGPDWSNRIYNRVFRLDRLADIIRGRNLTQGEDKASSKAVNAAIVSFATQWAQSSRRCSESGRKRNSNGETINHGAQPPTLPQAFDRKLQVASWHEARNALREAEGIESFRVVFAQIIFSLTQRPLDGKEDVRRSPAMRCGESSKGPETEADIYYPAEDKAVSECDELLSKLNLTIERDGPPVHLEKGVRLIHSLRSRMNIAGALGSDIFTEMPHSRRGKPPSQTLNHIDATDRATVDLLFWLGIMFDTLSSAMYKKPLVVSDEDSSVWSNATTETAQTTDGLWDNHLLERRSQDLPLRWPCSLEAATSLLCDAAPIRVLLFRKVTRLQTLLSRNVRKEKLEKAIKEALYVCSHWERVYAPFLRDCAAHHDLPPKIQSWYICLTGNWHFASLLLVDLVEVIDSAGLSVDRERRQRIANNFVTTYRQKNCYALSDLARRACPPSESAVNGSHFAVNQGSLLTEPWTVVLIRAFAKAGTLLLLAGWASCSRDPLPSYNEEPFRRAEDCVKALWYLGRKSDMALSAAETLDAALKKKRSACEIVMNSMHQFLDPAMWGVTVNLETFFG